MLDSVWLRQIYFALWVVALTVCSCYKRRAPRCMAMIRKFAQTAMCTEDVRIDPTVNKYVWNKGIHAVPARIRVRMSRISQDGEDGSKHVGSALLEWYVVLYRCWSCECSSLPPTPDDRHQCIIVLMAVLESDLYLEVCLTNNPLREACDGWLFQFEVVLALHFDWVRS